jgi:hypothetical protein
MINGVEYIAKLNDVMYHISNHKQTTLPLALIDRGTNGGVAGSDTWLIDKSLCSVHIEGIDDHMIKDIPIGTVGAVINTQHGEVTAIMHQYAYTGKGGTIHSSGQLEWCGNAVNNPSIKIEGSRQQLTTPDGYVVPIDVRRGLPYITMRPFTDEEFKELPHIVWMSEDTWDPTSLDSVISDDPNWYEAEPSPPLPNPLYDEYGEFHNFATKRLSFSTQVTRNTQYTSYMPFYGVVPWKQQHLLPIALVPLHPYRLNTPQYMPPTEL